MYKFPVVIQTEFNLTSIYPIMQKPVHQILHTLPTSIEKVIVFGSAVTLRCGEESDLDILLITKEDKSEMLKQLSKLCRGIKVDIDFVLKTPEEFEREIKETTQNISKEAYEKGVVIYERIISTC